jgi:hypothetical protein
MTRDEVMALTDEELRIKAAELAGWTGIRKDEDSRLCGIPPADWKTQDCGLLRGNKEWYLLDYPHDIAAAWELIDGAAKSSVFFPGDGEVDVWARMTFIDQDTGPRSGDCPGGLSAARAITRAFVLAMSGGSDA